MKIKNAALNLVVYFLYFFGSCVLVMLAEALLINHAFIIPYGITGGGYQATKLNTFEGQFATYGQATSRYKGQWIYEEAMSEDMYYAQLEAWNNAVNGN